ncbi:hypothetical protein FLM52_06110 [bacterium Scap17]|nr:hypothetical protein [bacterium Scap17]
MRHACAWNSFLINFPRPFALLCMDHGLRHGRRRSVSTVAGGAAPSLVLMALSCLEPDDHQAFSGSALRA